MADTVPQQPARTAYDLALMLGERLRHVYRNGGSDPLGAMLHAARREVDARNKAAAATQPVACAAGCAFCCHQEVSATAPEILLIAIRIMARPPSARGRLRSAIRKADAATRGVDPIRRWALRVPCPLLGPDRLCSVYEDRPFGCRGYASIDASACETAFDRADRSSPRQIPRPEPIRLNAIMLSYALERALAALGLAEHVYELNHGLTIALEIGPRAAIARYLAGEDVLAPARLRIPPPGARKG